MAEHNGGNRGGNDRGGFRGNNNSGGEPRGFRARTNRDGSDPARRSAGGGERKPFGDRDKKPYGDRENRSFGDRPRRDGEGDRRGFGGGERKPFGDRDRKPYGDRENRTFGERPRRDGEGDRRGFGGGERKPFGDRDRKPFGDRDRKPYGDRESRPFGDRPRRDGEGDRRGFGGGENRKPFGDRSERPARGDRQDRAPRSFDRGASRGDAGPRSFGRDRQEDRPVRVPNVRDLRSANRPDRERSPEIDEDVTGKELDRATQHQIKTLEAKSAEWVARHLVMAGRLIDEEPELAFQHALAASRRGGRLAAVREAVGLTAYAAGHYGEALREFRTYRRISGSNVHLPVMADCERGLGRPDRALDVARSEEAQDLDAPGKAELAIVAAGARTDLGQLDAAVAELEIPQLDINRAFSYSPRLFRAYADALSGVGRDEEAEKWRKQAVVAENALGQGVDEEPDIIDLGWDEEEEAREEAERRRLLERASQASETAPKAASAAGAAEAVPGASQASEPQDAGIDDQEADYFVSDDAESDEDSVEPDELETATENDGGADAGHAEAGDADGQDLEYQAGDQQDRRED
ncbi:hypothetical protein FJ661_19010 [Pseudarthrobacter phenanthrenivorans]|uniref:hypothetical protein n=1 Tax=Pseudarthrobacter phenanthrenivorans TaxID=361575 RepID=UPI00112E7CFF|nr:hypothetical protein [Pseudarthrobacter phenanthrenivorans]TPV48450.1 hypothetical protein FJ661_19010 [Pseudarthrobacter phenanthrenivorans]